MRGLRFYSDPGFAVPPSFAVIWVGPGCVFYAHHSAIRQGVDMIEREVAEGRAVLMNGMTAAEVTINQQAWALANTSVAGRA